MAANKVGDLCASENRVQGDWRTMDFDQKLEETKKQRQSEKDQNKVFKPIRDYNKIRQYENATKRAKVQELQKKNG